MKKTFLLLLCFSFLSAQDLLSIYQNPSELKTRQLWEINSDTETGNFVMGRIRDIKTDSDNNLYVLDISNQTILKFNSNGKFVKSIGRKGKGPGEFLRCNHFTITPDNNIITLDNRNKKISFFDSDGKYYKSVAITDYFWDINSVTDKLLLFKSSKSTPKGHNYYISYIDKNSNNFITLDSLMVNDIIREPEIGFSFSAPFSKGLFICNLKNDNFILATSSNFHIKHFDDQFNIKREFSFDTAKPKLTNKDKEFYFSAFGDTPYLDKIKKIVNFPDYKPFFEYVISDQKGNLLFKSYSDDNLFYIFNRNLDFVCKTNLPENLFSGKTLITQDGIIIVSRDDEGLPCIKKYVFDI